MLWTLIGILIALWLLGLVFEIAGGLVHILLVVALVVLIYRLITGRTAK
ncbi:lmo0937 family membrane protein [Alteribacillus sp. JSM 102045]